MQAILHASASHSSREHIPDSAIDDNDDSPVKEVEEAFEKTTLSITKENSKVVKGELIKKNTY